jgi:hypothetical protein
VALLADAEVWIQQQLERPKQAELASLVRLLPKAVAARSIPVETNEEVTAELVPTDARGVEAALTLLAQQDAQLITEWRESI